MPDPVGLTKVPLAKVPNSKLAPDTALCPLLQRPLLIDWFVVMGSTLPVWTQPCQVSGTFLCGVCMF